MTSITYSSLQHQTRRRGWQKEKIRNDPVLTTRLYQKVSTGTYESQNARIPLEMRGCSRVCIEVQGRAHQSLRHCRSDYDWKTRLLWAVRRTYSAT